VIKFPEQFRKNISRLPFVVNDQERGYFRIPHHSIKNYFFNCVAENGYNWEHVAVTLWSPDKKVRRCPTWEEMCFAKDLFWDLEEPVMQLHPPKSEWISNHPHCLHLWRPKKTWIPMPPAAMVGLKQKNHFR
jgi:hypothetical protein